MALELSKRITLRLPPELHETLTLLADTENRSLNNQIVWLLTAASDPNRLSDEQLLKKIRYFVNELAKETAKFNERLSKD